MFAAKHCRWNSIVAKGAALAQASIKSVKRLHLLSSYSKHLDLVSGSGISQWDYRLQIASDERP